MPASFDNMAAKVCPCPRCETLESSASQNIAHKHVNFTQKGKLLFIFILWSNIWLV